jgi:hypothetical protein
MPSDQNDLEKRIARLAKELDFLKAGLRQLGLQPCSCCGRYFLSSDGKALFDAGDLVCFSCLQTWWQQREPSLSVEARQAIEHRLARWLVAHHNAKIIRQAEKLPRPEMLQVKVVVSCEQCSGTGKLANGSRCGYCDGRGTLWVVELRPEFQ